MLLRNHASDGYPSDYLVARIKGRRAALIRDWHSKIGVGKSPGNSDDAIWDDFLRELDWVHTQMNPPLRALFATAFTLFELKTIVLCLRSRVADDIPRVERLLEHSLLSDPIRQALIGTTDLPSGIAALEDAMSAESATFRHLGAAYEAEGLRGFEDGLMRAFLEHASGADPHRVIAGFFEAFIDARNTIVLYKHLRWKLERRAQFINGGAIETSRLRELLEEGEEAAFDAFISEEMSIGMSPDLSGETALESLLLRQIGRKVRRAARESEIVGAILDYLWRVYAQARNLALLHHGVDVDQGSLEQELIL